MDNTNVATITTDFKGVLRRWLEFTHTFHRLTVQEQYVLSGFLYHYFQYKKDTNNEDMIWKLVFDYDTRLKVREELEIEDYTLQNVLTRLRKKEIIRDGKIRSIYIPNIKIGAKSFRLVYNFNIK